MANRAVASCRLAPGSRAWALLLAGLAILLPGRARAADNETRLYAVSVDGKRSGDYQLTITRQEDGSCALTGQTDVRVKYLVYSYRYTYRGTEVWKDGRLLRLDCRANDDGKRMTVTAVADGASTRVTVNGKEHLARGDVWLTSYSQLPAARQRNAAVALLDNDTGRDLNGRLQYVSTGPMNVAGEVQNCTHWRVTGDVQVDLWYDGQERLVHEEFTERGLRTVIDLIQRR